MEEKCIRLAAENEAARVEIESLKERNRLLEQKLDHLIRRLFGSKSDTIDPAQLELLFKDLPGKDPASTGADAPVEAAEKPSEKPRRNKRGGHRSRIAGLDRLPVEVTEVVPDMVASDPEAFERCGEEVTELLDVRPAEYFRRRIVRPKFRRKARRDLPPVVARAPVTPLVGGLPAAGLLAHLLVGKYIDHLPLYRQQSIFARAGLGIPRDLIVHWVHQAIGVLMPVALAIRRETLASDYLQVDESPVRYLQPGTGKARQGSMWVANAPGGSLFYHWGIGRGRDELIGCIGENFQGDIQSDGYSVYPSYQKHSGGTDLIACLAHIRRGFTEAFESSPSRHAAQVLRLIDPLYRIEKDLRRRKAGPALRESERAWRSAPIVRRLGAIMRVMLPRHRPQSPMGKALAYALAHWNRFARYLEDGRFEIDNNLVENCMRPLKLGAKNWLFFGSRDAGHAAAAMYTLVENCRRFGLPVEGYLKELLTRLPGTTDPEVIVSLTPSRIATLRTRRPTAA